MTETTDRFRDWDAAYMLGALSTDDRRAFERHMATCAECAAAVAELAGLPGILGKLSTNDAVALLDADTPVMGFWQDEHLKDAAHTPGLVQRLAASTRRRRRRIRVGVILGAFVIVALIGVGGVTYVANLTPQPVAVAMTPLHQNEITAALTVSKRGWGTRFDWHCAYRGTSWEGASVSYDLVVTQKSGAQTTVATWSSSGPTARDLAASSAIPTDDIKNVQIRLSGTTAPLLQENL